MNPAIERLYACMPTWLQNLGITLFGVAYRAERLGGQFERYAAEFRDREQWPASRFEDFVTERLRQTLVRAFDQTRYYHGRWSALGTALGALVFGAAFALQYLFQALGWGLPYQLFVALPYLLTLTLLALLRGRAVAPAALGKP